MTHNLTSAQVAPGLASNSGRDLALAIGAAFKAIFNRYRTGRALATFDDRMLADIGLTPGDVSSAFAGPIWRDPTVRLAVIAVERRVSGRSRARTAAGAETNAELNAG